MIVDRAVLRTSRKCVIPKSTQFPESFVQQVAVKLLQEVPIKDKKFFAAMLLSYLKPVENAG
jgi:hypothetical protein